MRLRNGLPDDPARAFLFSPASRYPDPVAYLADGAGTILHSWSSSVDQPNPEDDPPRYLRAWNHVELDGGGNLFAIVPLRSLLKLTPASDLVWSCDVAAHHDLAIGDDGAILVLTEALRRVGVGDATHVVQDNLVTVVGPDGAVETEVSLYDVLRTAPGLRRLIDDSIRRRSEAFGRRGWPAPEDGIPPAVVEETRAILSSGSYDGERRRAHQRLLDLPGKPCDVLHTNTVELLEAHPDGLWERGDVLLCMRELDAIAVVDLGRGEVRWCWGPGMLSHPHQPSMLPDGTILVYDNGVATERTRLVMVDPRTHEVVWTWSATPPESFFCPRAGGCERLANGNLLVTDSTAGGAFELTMDGRVLWRMTLPVELFGAERGPVSIYRVSAVEPGVVAQTLRNCA